VYAHRAPARNQEEDSVHQFDRSQFDHVGVVTTERRPGERWVEATRVWVTSPRDHPCNIEYLRFEPDSPVTGPVRTELHVAYRVTNIEQAIQGHDVVLAPFDVGDGFLTVAFVMVSGALIEFMQYANPEEAGWF
jgi:hypothetical protein